MSKHCCGEMDFFLAEKKLAIGFDPKFREYYIELRQSNGIQEIHFCPSCGGKLPTSLRDNWFDEIEQKFGIDDPFDEDSKQRIPKKYFTDEWWKV